MKNGILLKVSIAMLLAIAAGWATGTDMQIFGVPYVKIYGLIGQLFLNALMLVQVPLVISSIITGTARMGSEHSFGKLGAKTFGFYIGTTTLAVLVGLVCALLISPGAGFVEKAATLDITKLQAVSGQGGAFEKIEQMLFRLVPSNIFAVASQGQMLGLILFSLVFGFFISKIETEPSGIVLNFWRGIFQIMMRMTHLVMRLLPVGVFGLVAKVVATTGLEAVTSVSIFFFTVIIGLLIYALIVLPLLLAGIGRVNPIAHFRAMAPALFTAFSTSSSAASLPITMECVEKRAGVSNRICSFTIPLGASINLSGSALYQCVAVLFIAQVYGVEFSAMTLTMVVLMSVLTSLGTAGIPSAILISMMIVLNVIGVPLEGIGLVVAVERLLDMCRTVVNVLGNTTCAILVARSEGETVLTLPPPSIRTVGV